MILPKFEARYTLKYNRILDKDYLTELTGYGDTLDIAYADLNNSIAVYGSPIHYNYVRFYENDKLINVTTSLVKI